MRPLTVIPEEGNLLVDVWYFVLELSQGSLVSDGDSSHIIGMCGGATLARESMVQRNSVTRPAIYRMRIKTESGNRINLAMFGRDSRNLASYRILEE